MSETLSFSVQFPKEMLEELAFNVHGIESLEGLNLAGVISMIEDVVSTGIREHLDEDDEFKVTAGPAGSYTIQMAQNVLSDVATNVHGVDGLEGLESSDLAQLMGEIMDAGLDELLGYSDGVRVTPI